MATTVAAQGRGNTEEIPGEGEERRGHNETAYGRKANLRAIGA